MMTEADNLRRRADEVRTFLRSLPENGGEPAMAAWGAVVAMDDAATTLDQQRASLDAWASSSVRRIGSAIGGTASSFRDIPVDPDDVVLGLRGWAKHVREDDYLTAAETMERAAEMLDADVDVALLAEAMTPEGMVAVRAELDRLRSQVEALTAADVRSLPEWDALLEAVDRSDLRSVDGFVNLATHALSLIIATRTDG